MTIPSVYLHFTESDNSTTFIDEIGATTWSGNGDAKILDSALYCNGTDSSITASLSDDSFDVGGGNFTIHFYAKTLNLSVTQVLAEITGNGNMAIGQIDGNTFCILGNNTDNVVSPSTTISDMNWHHFAYVRDSNNFYQFIDGVSAGTPTDISGFSIPPSMGAVSLGGSVGYFFSGYMDDFCFIKGDAIWIDTFTPLPRTSPISSLYPYTIVIG
jgi:hypothetical protein